MKRWLRRLLYAVLLAVWFTILSLPVLAFALASRGQLFLGSETRHVRIFLVQETAVEAIGWEWTRPYRQNPDQACTRTTVHYLAWVGTAEGVGYCQCQDLATGNVRAGPELCQ